VNIVRTAEDWLPVERVLLSVWDKSGLDEFIPALVTINPTIRFYATGGTYRAVAGILGAAVVTLATYGVMMVYFSWRSHSFFDLDLCWDYLWKSLAAAALMVGVLRTMNGLLAGLSDAGFVALAVPAGGLVYLLCIWRMGVFPAEEIAYARRLIMHRQR